MSCACMHSLEKSNHGRLRSVFVVVVRSDGVRKRCYETNVKMLLVGQVLYICRPEIGLTHID